MFTIILSITLTLFSTLVLAYVSMATMLGPWIAPTVVLIAGLMFKLRMSTYSTEKKNESLALIQTSSSVGGIVATAIGFTLPTLYFLDQPTFMHLLERPFSFCAFIGSLVICAGSFGILLAKAFRKKMLEKESLPFPVSHFVHKTITSQTQGKQANKLIAGLSISGIICLIRDVFLPSKHFFNLFQVSPMLWAIGCIAGISIAFPLFIGMISKYLVLTPLNHHSLYLPIKFFPVMDKRIFSMAFCSGLALAGIAPAILRYPAFVWKKIRQLSGMGALRSLKLGSYKEITKSLASLSTVSIICLTALFFVALGFSPFSLIIILPLTGIAAYQISYIGGTIGLAQIGRFTTMVMIPTMLLFKLTPLQITALCVFVSSCITTATDLLFDYKIGELCRIPQKRLQLFQLLGLLVTALCVGFFMWLLFTHLQLGSAELFAQRGRSRALLIQSFSFNWVVVIFGLLYGLILKKLKINPAMVFGGILMQNQLTIGLLIGATATLFLKNKNEHFPLFSGIFAGESLWLIISIFSKL
jgi:uncharacterized oligopeptide transporter (OPT) family protein